MNTKTLQAAGVLLATFALGLGAGVGGALWLAQRPEPPAVSPNALPSKEEARSPEAGAPSGPPGAAEEAPPSEDASAVTHGKRRISPAAAPPPRALLESLDLSPEQRGAVREAIRETRESLGQGSRAYREEVSREAAHLLAALRQAAPEARTGILKERLSRLSEGRREALPQPPRVETGLQRWLARQRLPEESAARAREAIGRFMDRYWGIYRRANSAAGQARERAFERIQETFTPEQHERLQEEIRSRSLDEPEAEEPEGR